MDLVILFGVAVMLIALMAFLSARRFGVLALALASGAVLADLWSEKIAVLLSTMSLPSIGLPIGVSTEILLLIFPLVLLLFSGPRYQGRLSRLFSALAIGLLTVAFLVQPLGEYMILQGESQVFYNWLNRAWRYVVSAGLILGIVDLFISYTRRKEKSEKSKH